LNPYAPPESPVGPDIRPPSKVGIRHAVLIGLTTWLGMYMWDLVPTLWSMTVKNRMSPVIGALCSVVAITLVTGVFRANYRPWLGRRSFCLALAASAALILLFVLEWRRHPGGPFLSQLGFGIVWAALLAGVGAFMSFRAVAAVQHGEVDDKGRIG
jgi:hypothetical protein